MTRLMGWFYPDIYISIRSGHLFSVKKMWMLRRMHLWISNGRAICHMPVILRFRTVLSHKEQPVLLRLNSSFDFAEVSKVVSDLTGVKLCDLLKRRSKFQTERRLLVYCACKYCRSRISLSETGRIMHMSQSGVTQSERRFHKMMHSENQLKRLLNDVEQALKSKVGVWPLIPF